MYNRIEKYCTPDFMILVLNLNREVHIFERIQIRFNKFKTYNILLSANLNFSGHYTEQRHQAGHNVQAFHSYRYMPGMCVLWKKIE